jgi:type VI secretion system protein ImpE
MQEAKSKLDAGDLQGALEAAINLVKDNPTNYQARTFLFELSLFSGDWERASRQLDAIGHQDANATIGSMIYRQSLEVEKKRLKYFADGLKPDFITAVPEYVEDLLLANNRLREGNFAEAREILDKVEESRPAFACQINGQETEDFRDYNDLTMCVFEAIHKDQYLWVPFSEIGKIEFSAPKTLRDLFWTQATIELKNGMGGEMLLPVLYANSFKSENNQIRLGRMTDWQNLGEEIYLGEGLRMFWANGKEKAMPEIKEIKFVEER